MDKLYGNLTEKNVDLYAIKYYDNPCCCTIEDFYDDMNHIKYLKRLFRRYRSNGLLKERLILNHLIVIYNVFNVEVANRILFLKIEKEHYPVLKTFLVFLNYMQDVVYGINGEDIVTVKIGLDYGVVKRLRNI